MYKYETHTHTAECSKCATISARDLVKLYAGLDYAGICITDHFFNGNTAVDRNLPWREKVEIFYNSYEIALKEGKKLGLDVFWAWECTYSGNDFLIYGLDVDWMYSHPEIMDMEIREFFEFTRKCGGFIVHAHPFREADYIDMIRLLPRHVDAVETVNASMTDSVNTFAAQYADHYNLLHFAGSDTHHIFFNREKRLSGISFPEKIIDIRDLISHIKNGKGKIFTEIPK